MDKLTDAPLTSTRLARAGALWRRFEEAVAAGPGDPAGARTVFTRRQRLTLLLGFALLVMLRLPHAWLQGRFLDEEGEIFLAYAWHGPAAAALWHSFGGYLNLGANVPTLIAARLVRFGGMPLEWAPYLTMLTALAFQLLPAVLILTGRARWLANRWAVVASLLILATSGSTEEVFFNVLHIQFHLALCVALILVLDRPATLGGQIGYGVLLVLAPLCGPGAIVLLPFFGLRTLIERDPGRLAQTVVFAAATAVQMLVFFTPSPVRGHLMDPATLGAMLFVRLITLPLSTIWLANVFGHWIHISGLYRLVWWLAAAAAAGYFGWLSWTALRRGRDAALWLIVPGLAIAAVSFGGGMLNADPSDWLSVGAGERYNFLPEVLVGLGLVVLATQPGEGRYRRACLILCLFTIAMGAIAFPFPIPELSNGPSWRDEVAQWRDDHDYALVTWPDSWEVDLSDHDRPCSDPRLPDAAANDPSYCDSVWLARVRRDAVITQRKP